MARLDEYIPVGTGDTRSKTPAEAPIKRWFLLDGNRWSIAGILLLGVFGVFFVFGRLGVLSFRVSGSVTQLLFGFMTGNFTVIGLVITINQLILSWEFGAPGDLRERVGGVKQFRQDVETATETAVSPARPTDFLRLITLTIQQRADAVEKTTADVADQRLQERIDAYVGTVDEYTDQIDDILERGQFNTFNTLSSMLNYNDAWQIHTARWIRHEHADTLTEEAKEEIDDLIEILELFGVARAYFKTIYMEQELAKLSRVLFYVGIPSLFTAGTTILIYKANTGTTIPGEYLSLVMPVVVTIASAPVAVLFAYAIRFATVATRTPSIGVFHTEHQQRVIEEE